MLNSVITIGRIQFVNGEQLKKRRESLGLSQAELADHLHVARNTVWRWEQGQRRIPEFLELALQTVERNLNAQKSSNN